MTNPKVIEEADAIVDKLLRSGAIKPSEAAEKFQDEVRRLSKVSQAEPVAGTETDSDGYVVVNPK